MQTYKFNFYRAAKFVRSVRAYSVPDAVAMIPEFTDAKIHGLWTHAHQWIGLEALELIIEIEATKPVETKCPATYDVTGGHMQRASIIISSDNDDGEQFAAWLQQQGHTASVGNSTGNYINGALTSSDAEANETMGMLWNSYCNA